ncbi:serine/threonine-protein kinase [Merismopedia glauca]|uniref:non-specific serine/threonine protein kinase n=1 Tax=Merismopedia glauca CCAP 1448/3 TaxID=1296344 RepID=A0A2T1BZX1_9CYAN|nr:serine/threonine-protein kinase [Merismopedia glauca]PSB01458.1 serine/threonine protein kinase [Merismopedia glauca CCAP 1448/3]
MQPTLPPGTCLQKRYRILKTLGQGGFGRTYLAEDRSESQDMCVLKEFFPSGEGSYSLNKSKELFYREAAVLQQIDHPQIPKVRGTFENSKRLFLVQDYAGGKTYAALLTERLKEGKSFNEGEAIEFLLNMLPVLEYIHKKGIVHRDISPDNIILRDRDQLPVLIDFGVVKAGICPTAGQQEVAQGTTVGKVGYSPSEQLQTGQVYPNSDLYALAVTTVVLMTGRKPEALLDQSTMTWRWHQWLPGLSPWFGQILNRMLSHRPNQRYSSATEVAQALRSIEGLAGNSLPPRTSTPPAMVSSVSRQPAVKSSSKPITRGTYQRQRNPLWDSPWTVGLILGGGMVAVALIPLVLFGQMSISKPTRSGQLQPTPSITQFNAPGDTSTPSEGQPQRLNVLQGQILSPIGNVKANQVITYVVSGQKGHQLQAAIAKGGVVLTVLPPKEVNLDSPSQLVSKWQGTLPATGDYQIQVIPAPGVTDSNYQVDISLTIPSSYPNTYKNNLSSTPTLASSAKP